MIVRTVMSCHMSVALVVLGGGRVCAGVVGVVGAVCWWCGCY